MDKKNLMYLIAIVIVLSFILKMTFKFLGVPLYKFGIYLLWIFAISLLLLVLPQKTGELFSK
jgi:hypothetical protein